VCEYAYPPRQWAWPWYGDEGRDSAKSAIEEEIIQAACLVLVDQEYNIQ
jgi:hypothetical protein